MLADRLTVATLDCLTVSCGALASMQHPPSRTVDRLLEGVRQGQPDALSQLLPLLYEELRAIARRQRRDWNGEETLDTTALVHEAYLRLADQSQAQWESEAHFLAVAATAMRQILIDYAKRRRATKRGGHQRRVSLRDIDGALRGAGEWEEVVPDALIALDESLHRLEAHDQRLSRIVECRFFGGMTIQDTAKALGIGPATVTRGWTMAKAWLYRDLVRALEEEA